MVEAAKQINDVQLARLRDRRDFLSNDYASANAAQDWARCELNGRLWTSFARTLSRLGLPEPMYLG